ncbi:MAG: sulfite reductase flavoprotein subunit alpha [Silvibacterium sp.]
MPVSLIPCIPEDAPFTPTQRKWLNGYLAGLYSYAPAQQAEMSQTLRIAVLYGSQTGTAEGLSRKLSKELKAAGYTVLLSSLEGYVPATLAAETHALFIVSTYGEGEAPDGVQPFYQQLCVEHFPLLGNLSYAVLALGDSHYEHFCQFGKELDIKLDILGGTRMLARVDSDVDVNAPYSAWKEAVGKRLRELSSPSNVAAGASTDVRNIAATGSSVPMLKAAEPAHSRDNPYLSPLTEKRVLTHPSSSKLTIHLDFAIGDSAIRYEAGDACGVLPQNPPDLVDTVLSLLPFSGNEPVEIPQTGSVALREGLFRHFAITRLTRKMVADYAALAQCSRLGALLAPEQQEELKQYLYGRDLVDLLQQCPGVLQTPEQLVKMLPRLAPRLYSISSSPAAHPGQVHTTVSVLRYRSHGRERGGVCSTLLSDRIEVGDRLPIYIQPNKKFSLPQDSTAPIIMIGPGTGIAPFRGFLHERRVTGAPGRNWLFFGERSATTDFLYREELETMLTDGHLTQLSTAFSRDQEGKIYVQDLMVQNAEQFWAWMEEGAFVYICGDALRMAKDVDKTLLKIVREQGSMSKEVAELYLQALKDDHRYQRDVY